MHKILLTQYILIFVFCMVSTLRAETRIGLETFKINPETSLELTSKSMTFNSQTKKARFVDDVKVKYGQYNYRL